MRATGIFTRCLVCTSSLPTVICKHSSSSSCRDAHMQQIRAFWNDSPRNKAILGCGSLMWVALVCVFCSVLVTAFSDQQPDVTTQPAIDQVQQLFPPLTNTPAVFAPTVDPSALISTLSPTFTPLPTQPPVPASTSLPAATVAPIDTPFPTNPPIVPTVYAGCDCSGNVYNCPDFSTHAEAQACHDFCFDQGAGDIHGLDGNNNNGLACEDLP